MHLVSQAVALANAYQVALCLLQGNTVSSWLLAATCEIPCIASRALHCCIHGAVHETKQHRDHAHASWGLALTLFTDMQAYCGRPQGRLRTQGRYLAVGAGSGALSQLRVGGGGLAPERLPALGLALQRPAVRLQRRDLPAHALHLLPHAARLRTNPTPSQRRLAVFIQGVSYHVGIHPLAALRSSVWLVLSAVTGMASRLLGVARVQGR